MKLGNVAEFIRGITFKPDDLVEPQSKDSFVCFRTKNVQADLDESDLIAVPKSFVKNTSKIVGPGDLLVSSANSWNLVGKCCWVPEIDYDATAGGFISILRANPSQLFPRYLYHWFASPEIQFRVRSLGNQTTNISNLNLKRCLQIPIPLPPLPEQKRIAEILNAADDLRTKRQESLTLLNELLQSTFLDMFGDPVKNTKAWKTISLEDHGSFKNGLNYNKSESGFTSRILGVGDFKDHTRIKNMESLSEIQLSSKPSDGYLLQDHDIVFVRSNGNKQLVGRSVYVTPGSTPVTFSGFCIRYRIESPALHPLFLVYLFRNSSFRSYLLGSGQGANIQNISQKNLNKLKIIAPPTKDQKSFVKTLSSIESYRSKLLQQLTELDTLFASLQSRAFKGEL